MVEFELIQGLKKNETTESKVEVISVPAPMSLKKRYYALARRIQDFIDRQPPGEKETKYKKISDHSREVLTKMLDELERKLEESNEVSA